MCDYSLCGIPNRLATEGEELSVHKFSTGSIGLASTSEILASQRAEEPDSGRSLRHRIKSFVKGQAPPQVAAVCVPPGANLIVKNIPPALQSAWELTDEECVVFVQLSATPNTYRDAIRFNNGRQVRLQSLPEGLPLQVLSLAGAAALERYEENFTADERREVVSHQRE